MSTKGKTERHIDVIGSDETSFIDEGNAYGLSVAVLIVLRISDAIEYGLIMPSLYRYLELMPDINDRNKAHYYGIVLASFSFASLLMKPLLGRYTDIRSFREAFVITIVVAIAGNVLYSLAYYLGSVKYALAGRLLSGVGAANTSLTFPYVARTLPPTKRTGVMLLLSIGFPLGMVLGPATNLLTYSIDFTYHGFHVDECNSPALVIACFLLLLLIFIVIFLVEPESYDQEKVDSSHGCSEVCRAAFEIKPFTCMITVFAVNFVLSTTEGLIVPITHSVFGWHPLQNSYVYCGVAVELLVITFLIKSQLTFVSDSNLVLSAHIFFFAGLICAFFLWTYSMPVWHYLVSTAVCLAGLPLVFAPNRSRFTKVIEGSVHQGTLSSFVSLSASMGGIIGPLWLGATVGTKRSGPVARVTLLGLFASVFITFWLNVIGWSCRTPLKDPELLLQNDTQIWDDIPTEILERLANVQNEDIKKELHRRKTLEDHRITS